MTLTLTWQSIITAGAVLGALGVVIGVFVKAVRWVDRQKKQDKEIAALREENCLLCYGLSACLDGLIQLGANHSVPIAKEKLDKHLNQAAHEVET